MFPAPLRANLPSFYGNGGSPKIKTVLRNPWREREGGEGEEFQFENGFATLMGLKSGQVASRVEFEVQTFQLRAGRLEDA